MDRQHSFPTCWNSDTSRLTTLAQTALIYVKFRMALMMLSIWAIAIENVRLFEAERQTPFCFSHRPFTALATIPLIFRCRALATTP